MLAAGIIHVLGGFLVGGFVPWILLDMTVRDPSPGERRPRCRLGGRDRTPRRSGRRHIEPLRIAGRAALPFAADALSPGVGRWR